MQFLDELDSPALLQPRLLQLRAAYAQNDQNDSYLKGGHHLRWVPHPTFGFPRRGFLLSARKSPSPELEEEENMVETSLENPRGLGSGALWSPAYTLESGKQVGVRISRPDGSSSGPSVTLEFVDETGRPNPAAWVAVILSLQLGSEASVKAIARADGRLGQKEVIVSEMENDYGSLTQVEKGKVISLSGGHITSVTVLAPDGGELEINRVRWIPADSYANSGRWQPLERFLLPYEGNGSDYPELSRDVDARLEEVGLEYSPPWSEGGRAELVTNEVKERYVRNGELSRLKGHLGKMLLSEKDVPQPQVDYKLGDPDEGRMWTGGQSSGDSDLDDVEGLEVPLVQFLLGASMGTPFAHLLGLAHFLDPNDDNNRLDPDSQYDFKISAVYPHRWWKEVLKDVFSEQVVRNIFPNLQGGGTIIPQIPDAGALPPDDAKFPKKIEDQNLDFFRVVSLATDVGPNNPLKEPVPKPHNLTVELQDAPGEEPIPVEAVVSWSLPKKILDWEEMQDWEAPVVGYMAERADSKGKILLDGRERNPDQSGDETDEEVRPRLIDLDENKHELRDAGLRVDDKRVDDEDEDTTTTWKVYLMDFWGRWSEAESVTDTVKDNTPPPPPSGLTAEFESDLDTPSSTNDNPMVLEFKYGKGVVNQARDLSSFEIYLVGGNVESGSEETVGSPDYTVTVEISQTDGEFKLQSAEVNEDGVSATVVNPNEGSTNEEDDKPNEEKARRVRVEGITGPAAEEETYHWHTTALVRAVDDADNKSKPATGVATFVESVVEKVPAPEVDDIEYTTWPDADDLGWWRCEWKPDNFKDKERTRIQVLRTSGARLLAEAGKDRDGVSGSLADELRYLALENRHAFAPDHPESYDVQRGHHDVAIEASSRDLHLVLVMPTGPTGERSEWPESKDKFAVIAARPLKPVSQPRLNAHSEDVRVHLDLSVVQDVERIRVWRATPDTEMDDLRKMHPLKPIDVQARDSDGEDDSPEDDESSMRTGLSQVDENVEPSTWYAYRAVAEAKDGRRSAPTEPVWVQTD